MELVVFPIGYVCIGNRLDQHISVFKEKFTLEEAMLDIPGSDILLGAAGNCLLVAAAGL